MPAAGPNRDPDRPFELFISYSHQREAVKDRLLVHLAPLRRAGLVSTWTDRAIPPGVLWREEIAAAIERADAAVFIVCADFLNSDFCMDEELPVFLERQRDDGILVLFVLADHCNWELDPIIKAHQLVPRDGKPIVAHHRHSTAYTAVVREIHQVLAKHRKTRGLARRAVSPVQPAAPDTAALHGLLAELPGATGRLHGRDADLAHLDTCFGAGPGTQPGGVLLWVAAGGVGKSALTRWWLAHRDWPAGTRFIGHSFYSQGSRNQSTSARAFLLRALADLGDRPEPTTADQDLGQRLAERAALAPTVLALDGLEPLQQAADDPKLNGQLKDQGLAALLEGLGRAPGQALCIATSRLPIPDPLIAAQPCFHQVQLHLLPRAGSVALLAARGIIGTPVELDAMAARCADHPLALVLAAELTHGFLDDQSAAFLQRDWPLPTDAGPDRHAATIMGWFDAALRDEHAALDRALLRVLGLFDRPAPRGAIRALADQAPPIAGLTEPLHAATDAELDESLARLRQWGLAAVADATPTDPLAGGLPTLLDAHPLVREHFGRALEQEHPTAWRAAHGLLFDWFRGLPAQHRPDRLEDLEPLYRAIGHGCRAGRYAQARREVYQDRILRGNRGYSAFQLGAISADLSALAGFFPDGWAQPPVTGDLDEADRSWLIAMVAFCLMSLGRLDEALGPGRMHLDRSREAGDWNEFCIASQNLVDLLTPLGHWGEAETVAREAIEAAKRVADQDKARQRRLVVLAKLGRALHGQGRMLEAAPAFTDAEAVQAEMTPHDPTLASLPGLDYAQLLLEQARAPADRDAVLGRARASLAYQEATRHLLSIALDHCTIGQALAGSDGAQARSDAEAQEALASLDRAIATMHRANAMFLVPTLYLTRAHHRRNRGDPAGARADLDAALAIATPPGMRTTLAEAALLAGQLALDRAADVDPAARAPDPRPTDPLLDAASQWALADHLIRETGYGRREAELHLLEARLRQHQGRPIEAHAAIARAEARLRALGQWGLWPQLTRTATELGLPAPVMYLP